MKPGSVLGPYEIVAPLGAGGMGEVYRAHHAKLDRDVALKVLPATSFADPAARARLLQEARAAARLNHPNICTVHDVGEVDGQACIAMELVDGDPLDVRLSREKLPVVETMRYARHLADALSNAHGRRVVHRDLKSANVVITPDGRAKVLDFGLAKLVRDSELDGTTRSLASLTTPGTVMGTLACMAPEQLRGGPADARSDIWTLGVVMYEMAAFAAAMGQPDDTSTAFEVALESDPHNPQLRDWYGHQLLRLRRYDEAIVQFHRVLDAEPNFTSSVDGLWSAYHFKRLHGEAAHYAARLLTAGASPKFGAAFEREERPAERRCRREPGPSRGRQRSGWREALGE